MQRLGKVGESMGGDGDQCFQLEVVKIIKVLLCHLLLSGDKMTLFDLNGGFRWVMFREHDVVRLQTASTVTLVGHGVDPNPGGAVRGRPWRSTVQSSKKER